LVLNEQKRFLGEINEYEKEKNSLQSTFEGPTSVIGSPKKSAKGYGHLTEV